MTLSQITTPDNSLTCSPDTVTLPWNQSKCVPDDVIAASIALFRRSMAGVVRKPSPMDEPDDTPVASKPVCAAPEQRAEFAPDDYKHACSFANQQHIDRKMFRILADWLFDVAAKMRLEPHVYFLAIDIAKRYIAAKSDIKRSKLQLVGTAAFYIAAKSDIKRSKLQLVGTAAFYMAAKIECVYDRVELRNLVWITDRAYTRKEIVAAEYDIFKVLQCETHRHTVLDHITFMLDAQPMGMLDRPATMSVFPKLVVCAKGGSPCGGHAWGVNTKAHIYRATAFALTAVMLPNISVRWSQREIAAGAVFYAKHMPAVKFGAGTVHPDMDAIIAVANK